MPRTKSAKKTLRKEKRRKARNLWHKKRIKETGLKIKKFIEAKNLKEAKKLLPLFYKFVDKAQKVGVLKKNTASRMKSKMARELASLEV
ncbi:MAG: 30S ribosomal protein S20 [Candidatus Pacebacteria bacterium]|nr:30S ribosomal protein S20 [Candidatus Paceibacterota bacterium]